MITGKQEELEQICKSHVCPEHGPKLVVAWHAGENNYVIRCGERHFPEEVTQELTPTREFKQGKRPAVDNLFNLLPSADLATGEVLSPIIVQGIIGYANKYGLDPYRGHVVVMYGEPYIGLDGYLYHANKTGIPYSLTGKPLSKEQREVFLVEAGAHAWLSTVERLDTKQTFIGLGIVTMEEMTEESKKKPGQLRSPVVAAHPWQLAQKRAEWQAMRRAFPIGKAKEE